jgi:hypothetical protein
VRSNKYFAFGPDPVKAIATVGFTKKVQLFGITAFQHESLPLDMRFSDHETGWELVMDGEKRVSIPFDLGHLRTIVDLHLSKQFFEDIEQRIGDMLRSMGVEMNGYACRKVEAVALDLRSLMPKTANRMEASK